MTIKQKIDWTRNRLQVLDKRQSWLAEQTGISNGQISHFLSGKSDITLTKWLKIENVLK